MSDEEDAASAPLPVRDLLFRVVMGLMAALGGTVVGLVTAAVWLSPLALWAHCGLTAVLAALLTVALFYGADEFL